jgi:uncharacterized protein YbjT (DUF2867 family)
MTKTAIIIGATGLTGNELTQLLLNDEGFSRVKIFVRRATGTTHPKLEEHIVNFDQVDEWSQLVSGDVLFSALGTTLKKAGGKKAQFEVDYTFQYNFAVAASRNAVPNYVLVSSAYSSAASPIFYSRIKGELERDIKELPFKHIHIFQPGPLWGKREERRIFEEWNVKMTKVINRLGLLKRIRPLHGSELAQAMINASCDHTEKIKVYVLDQIFNLIITS